MTDIIDRACDLEQMQRDIAIAAQQHRTNKNAVSAQECDECGEAIPEERRRAVVGCRHCIDCKQELEQHGKTRFAAPAIG